MPQLSADDLKNALDLIFTQMEKKGIHVNNDKKEECKNEIASELHNQLSFDDIKDTNVQKKLICCITSLLTGKKASENDAFNDLIHHLKSEDKHQPDNNVENKLKVELPLLKLLMTFIASDKNNEKQLTRDEFFKKLLHPEPKKDKAGKDEKSEKEEEKAYLLEKQLDDCLRNLFGGDNPTISGEVQFPIIGPIVGNLMGLTNQSTPDPKAVALMVDLVTHNPNKADYMGLEKIAETADLINGVNEAINDTMSSAPKPSPLKMR